MNRTARGEPRRDFEEDREHPCTVSVEVLTVHDHHVEDVGAAPAHELTPLIEVFWGHVLQHRLCDIEVVGVHRMRVMRIDRLNEIMALLGQHNWVGGKDLLQLRSLDDAVIPIPGMPFEEAGDGEVAAVMHQPLIVAGVVLP